MQSLSTLPDDKLVAAYLIGNNSAFDLLLKRHQSRVYSYILSIVKQRSIADDLFQETFVKAIITIKQGQYVHNGKFLPWICRIAHNLIIDHFRQGNSNNMVQTDAFDADIYNRKELSDGNIEDSMISDQISSDVRRLVAALPDSQREVLEMRYYRDMSFKEIAEATDVSINTALGRMRYAILNMRRIASENNIVLTL